MRNTTTTALIWLSLALALAGCGSTSSSSSTAASVSGAAGTSSAGTPPPALDQLGQAERPQAGQFPRVAGKTLEQLAATAKPGIVLGAATGTFTPGRGRFAFALNVASGGFIYAPTALYISRSPSSRSVRGPFLAPADPLTVPPAYRSVQNSGPGGIAAIYAADLPLVAPGTYAVLALALTRQGSVAARAELAVAASSPIPAVGQRPPAVSTDTAASDHGDPTLLTTRVPRESMHSVSFRDVLGKRPIALLFSTPQLCQSRVCGPVTDIAVALQHKFGGRITFIHQEVYVDNQPTKGLRAPLKAFGLQTEPWLFTIDRRGRIVARLEGSFGVKAVTSALQTALR